MGNVVQIRNLTLGKGLPKICIPLTDTDLYSLQQSAQTILKSPCDLVEWRADFYSGFREEHVRTEALQVLRKTLGDIPLLFTIRTREEGGQADISVEEYEEINRSVIESGLADLVDVELSKGDDVMMALCKTAHPAATHATTSLARSYAESASDADTFDCPATVKIVASKHDFHKTPSESEIVNSLCRMQTLGADIAKYAVMPNSERDVLTLLSATIIMKEQHPDTPVITMSMGRLGAVSRVCGALSGSAVTFGTAGSASAPGQLPADVLRQFLEHL